MRGHGLRGPVTAFSSGQRPAALSGSYLVLELSNRCSLACVHCSVAEGVAHPHHKVTGRLDPELAYALFDDLAETGTRFDTLILFWLGEPLLHPHFGPIYRAALRAAQQHGSFNKVEVHTNATHLDARRIRGALNASPVPQVWHFSLDAASQETYTPIKGKDRFDRVQANVADFIVARAQLAAPYPRPVFQFIVGSNNVHEVGAFRAHWEGVCKQAGVPVRAAAQHVPPGTDAVVFFRQLDCPTAEMQARENAVFRQAMEEQGLPLPRQDKAPVQVAAKNLSPCSGYWKSPVIGWDGKLTVCTRDNRLENSVGTLAESSFGELWYGEKLQERRERVAQGDYSLTPLCTTCFIPKSSNHSDINADEIATFNRRNP